MRKCILNIFVLLFVFSHYGNAQGNARIDSLKVLLEKAEGREKADLLNQLSKQYWHVSPVTSLEHAMDALDIAKKLNDTKYIAEATNRIGSSFYYMENYDESLDHYLKSLKLYEEINDSLGIARLLNNVGLIYYIRGDKRKSTEYFLHAIKIIQTIGKKKEVLRVYSNLATMYTELHEFDKAEEYLTQSYLIAKQSKNMEMLISTIINLGDLYLHKENYDRALDSIQKSLELNRVYGNEYTLIIIYRTLGEIYIALNEIDSAKSNLNKAYLITRKFDSDYHRSIIYNYYSQLFEKTGDHEKALAYYKDYISLKDSIFNERNNRQIAEALVKYQVTKKENEIELLKKENEIKALEARKNKSILYLLLGLLLFMLVLIFIGIKNLQIKKRKNQLLWEKNRQFQLMNQKLKESENQLKELNAMKNKIFSIISHDLKNPFNALLGFSELLAKNAKDFEKQDIVNYSKIIYASASNMHHLLENLLNWSRSQVGKIKIQPQYFDFNKVAIQEISLMAMNAKEKEIDLKSELKGSNRVFADPNIISTVLRNLLSNSIKFSKPGGFVKVYNEHLDNFIKITVEDNGIGINQENLKNLFQLHKAYTTKGTHNEEGTGIGLLLSKEFIEKSGGEIWAESIENKGSKFFFTIPKYPIDNNKSNQVDEKKYYIQ